MVAGAGAASAQTDRIFVSNEDGDSLTVIDAGTLEVTERVPVCDRPRDIGWGPKGARIFVACGSSDEIAIFDPDTLQVTGRITGVPEPEAFDIGADGTLYVTNEDDALLTAYDTASLLQTGSVDTSVEPEGITVDPETGRVWVTTEASSLVHVFEPDSLKLVEDILVDTRPRRIARRPNSNEIWVTAELGGQIDVIDVNSLKIVDQISLVPEEGDEASISPVGMAFSPDGAVAHVALGRGNAVAEVDATTGQVGRFIPVGTRPWNLVRDEQAGRLYVANGPSGTISVISLPESEVVKTVEVGDGPYDILLEPAP